MSEETESHEFIGWYEGYHAYDADIAKLKAEIERLRAALMKAKEDLYAAAMYDDDPAWEAARQIERTLAE